MCRLLAITSQDYVSTETAVTGLAAMCEGYDGSGVGILLRDIGGPFEDMKNIPVLSGVFSAAGLKRLDRFMMDKGFTTKYKITFKTNGSLPVGIPSGMSIWCGPMTTQRNGMISRTMNCCSN
jgi:hypothetical protein